MTADTEVNLCSTYPLKETHHPIDNRSMGVPGVNVVGASAQRSELPRFYREGGDNERIAEPAIIKIEEDDEDSSDKCFHDIGGSPSEAVPKPMEGLHEAGPPPFLKKTFEMVEDPDSDAVVSWSRSGKSFVVWDQHEFSRDLLPKYFKHNNYSSFIRQLNTYGFRKIDSDRWDFAHEFFQRGKKPLLKNIRRRARPNHPHRSCSSLVISDSRKPALDIEAETEILKRDQDKLRFEILKLRKQQSTSRDEISSIEDSIRRAENRHHHMFLFLAKAIKNPNLAEQLIQRKRCAEMGQLEMPGEHISKKRQGLHQMPFDPAAAEFLIEVMKPNLGDGENKESGGLLGAVGQDPMNREMFPSGSACGLPGMPDADQVVSENFLGDDGSIVENETNSLKDSDVYLELEGLIGEPGEYWDGYGHEFLDRANYVGLMP